MPKETAPTPDPVFDPNRPGHSLDRFQAVIPVHANLLAGLVFGEAVSRRVGQGIEIDGIREYQFGDDARHVDWRATARQAGGTLMVREHYQDVTPTVWLVTDALQGRHRANAGYFSEESLAASALLVLAQIADRQGMPTGVVTAGSTELWSAQPDRGSTHLLRVSHHMAKDMLAGKNEQPEKPATTLPTALRHVARFATDNLVIVVSDFRETTDPTDNDGWQRALQQLHHQGNQVTTVELTNLWDFELPGEASRFTLGRSAVFIGGRKERRLRETYSQLAGEQQTAIDQGITAGRAAHLRLTTDEPQWFKSLRTQLHKLAVRGRTTA